MEDMYNKYCDSKSNINKYLTKLHLANVDDRPWLLPTVEQEITNWRLLLEYL